MRHVTKDSSFPDKGHWSTPFSPPLVVHFKIRKRCPSLLTCMTRHNRNQLCPKITHHIIPVWFINVFSPVDIVVNNKWSLIMARRSVVPQSRRMVWVFNIIVVFGQYFKWSEKSVGIYIVGGYMDQK